MMVQHMVWIAFNPGVDDITINEILEGLRALKTQVPGVIHLSVGENFTDRAPGVTHALLVTLESKEALATYAQHPAHVAAAGPLKANASLTAVDYEFMD